MISRVKVKHGSRNTIEEKAGGTDTGDTDTDNTDTFIFLLEGLWAAWVLY